jgi:methionine biosynthesis protein MetW
MREKNRNHFNAIWQRKLESPSTTGMSGVLNRRVEKASKVLSGGSRLLDIGCGNGELLLAVQTRYDEVYGIDIAEAALGSARKYGINVQAVDLNREDLPFPDQYFDALTILSTLQYFQDLYVVLGECNRVLSPSGVLLLSLPNMRSFWRVGRLLIEGSFPRVSLDPEGYDGGTLHYFAYANLKDLLHETGFDVLLAHGIFCLPRFLEGFPDGGLPGKIKREFFSAETFVMARKR